MLPGHSRLAICKVSPSRAFSQSSSTCGRSKPRMLTMPLGVASAASCIASPRTCTSRNPSSKSITPAKTSAVYSPRLKPAAASQAQHHVGRVGPQALDGRQAGDEQRRLADHGRVELFGRAFEAELRQVVAQDVAGAIVELAAPRAAIRPLAGPCRPFERPGREREKQSCSRP